MKQSLGSMEAQFFAYAQLRSLSRVRSGDLGASGLRLAPGQERKLFSRLARGGLIARVRPGLYLVPPRLPLGGAWTPSEAEALNALMEDAGGRYQVCGPGAFNRHGFDNQVPNLVHAYNNRISGRRKVGAVNLVLIKVADNRLGDTVRVGAPGVRMVYASRARSLVDAVYDWSRFDGIPRGYDWIRQELAAGRVTAAELVRCALRYGDTGTLRRLGVLLEHTGAEPALLRRLEQALRPSTSLIPWIPTRPKRGRPDRRWGVVINGQY